MQPEKMCDVQQASTMLTDTLARFYFLDSNNIETMAIGPAISCMPTASETGCGNVIAGHSRQCHSRGGIWIVGTSNKMYKLMAPDKDTRPISV
jgi:hypothetical protein